MTLVTTPNGHRPKMDRLLAELKDSSYDDLPALQKTLSQRFPEVYPAPASDSDGWEQPFPLQQFDLPPFPTSALPSWMGDYVRSEAEATQTPEDLAGCLVLGVAGASLAKKYEVEVTTGFVEPLNLYTMVALDVGERKSVVYRHILRPVDDYERSENDRLKSEVAQSEAKRSLLEAKLERAKKDAVGGKATDEEVAAAAATLADCQVTRALKLVVDDITPERLGTVLAEQGGRVLLSSPEGDLFDIIGGRYNKDGGIHGVYLKGHSGDTLRVSRGGRPDETVHSPALTIALAVQPDVLRGLVHRPGFRGKGLLARFLCSIPRSLVGYRSNSPASISGELITGYHDGIKHLLGMPLPETTPLRLTLSKDAADLMLQYRDRVEKLLRPGGALYDIRDWGGKLVGAVARLAGILHVCDGWTGKSDPGEPISLVISESVIRRAIALGEYFTQHALAAFCLMGASAVIELAKAILAWLDRREAKTAPFSRRDAHRALENRVQRVEELDGPIRVLEDRGFIRPLPVVANAAGGRPASPLYEINPRYKANSGETPTEPTELPSAPGSVGSVGKLVASENESS